MPKLKTSKTIKKRFKISSTGKVSYKKAGRRHLLSGKTTSHKRKMRTGKAIDHTDLKRVIVRLPYA
jgi:large subunit ribosomal protein L35